jgi:hypothetical protein
MMWTAEPRAVCEGVTCASAGLVQATILSNEYCISRHEAETASTVAYAGHVSLRLRGEITFFELP